MTFDQVIAAMTPYVGSRIRVTYPNGYRRVGVLGLWREHLTLGSYLCGGEYDGAVKVEVMATNGRYQEVSSD